MKKNAILRSLEQRAGIVFMGVDADLQVENAAKSVRYAFDGGFACDAQPTLITQSNAGIPAFLSNYIDPKLIEVLVSPMKAAEITGDEAKKGDWTTETAMFPIVESTGQTSAYGDYSESGNAGVNVNFPQRQSFHYQVITQWGERELEKAGLARIDWANRTNIASILTLNKYQNKTYFFGVEGLQNYGLLNDPGLNATIVPTTKVAGGTAWSGATALEVLADVTKLFKQLQTQANGNVQLDTKMTLAMSPLSEVYLTDTTQFNVNVQDLLKKNFPNLTVKTAVEYSTDSGELLQLIADEVDGQRTASCCFTEKLRAHPIVVNMSSFKQKKSQGSFGTVVYVPAMVAGMLGV
jgi:hypothetical protein